MTTASPGTGGPVRESSSPCMEKLDRIRWITWDWFEIDGYRFGARTTSHRFAEWVRYVLASYQVDRPSTPEEDPLFSIIVQDEQDQRRLADKRLMILYEGTADIVRTMDVRAIAVSLLHELEAITFPTRDDALYLEASVIYGHAGVVLIPWMMVPVINGASRQIARSVDLVLPGTVSIPVDRSTGGLLPVAPTLKLPPDAIGALGGYVKIGAEEDVRALPAEPRRIDRVVVLGGDRWEPVLRPTVSRSAALFQLASAVRNAGALEGSALETLRHLVDSSEVLEIRWTTRRDLVDVVAAAVEGDTFEPDREGVSA